ncbi:uncharacterized protein At4g22758-like [Impatiens glandulifera]|uniref:uncharacterized protein At4g22758-like n=1 Tax=Impatiens glandulifera TaxID=253017 RepID=UPI001FB0C504|nr:uncharacterized protein At4g22758-like [Impatiens glandulifera]
MFLQKQQQKKKSNSNRLLVSITVLGSAGPIRFVVNEEDIVSAVIEIALKNYAKEGRFPVIGSYSDDFILYCSFYGTDALDPLMKIGSAGVRNFMLFKKPSPQVEGFDEDQVKKQEIDASRKRNGGIKSWFNKSLNLKVSSH